MPRFPLAEHHGIRSLRIRGGHGAAVVDASAGGALVDTNHRLMPGSTVELQVEGDGQRTTVRGRVVRCAVIQVRAATVFYRGAIAFDRHLPWEVPGDGNSILGPECRDFRRGGVAATHIVV